MEIKVTYNIYEIRKAQGLSVRGLAEISGVSKSQINKIENNLGHPTVYVLCKLAIALNVKPSELFTVSFL